MTGLAAVPACGFCLLLLAGCGRGQQPEAAVPSADGPLFREAAGETGLRFHHFLGATGEYYTPEIVGAGGALFDYDGDGDLDLYLVQGTLLDNSKTLRESIFSPPKDHLPGNRLFRNELIPGGKLRFTDVTEQAGVGYQGYGMGVAVGDYDGDGHPDLYVTNLGSNVLYRNNGNGAFTDVTARAGVADGLWSSSAAFADYDGDGDLDLFVVHYLDFTLRKNQVCPGLLGHRDYCGPGVYRPLTARLYRNEGNGRFLDVTQTSGIGSAAGNGLGISCADLNGDGRLDIYVANDMTANHLWLNQGKGAFKEAGLIAGAAFNAEGAAEAGMGVAIGDFDGDGDEDVFVTNFSRQHNTLYRNDGSGMFQDVTAELGLAHVSVPYTGFGTGWFDYDNDGFLDLFVANGTVERIDSLPAHPHPYGQRDQLFRNEGAGRPFRETTLEAGPAFQFLEAGRGAAFGDIDNDGDIDIVVTNNNGPVRLLLNQTGNRRPWLSVRLEARGNNRQGVGARVAVLRRGRVPLWRRAHTDGSYLSANDVRVHFGLGADSTLEGVVVRWPGGKTEIWKDIRHNTFVRLKEGTGQPWK